MEKQSNYDIVNMKTATTAAVSASAFFNAWMLLIAMTFRISLRLPTIFIIFNISPQLLVLSQVDRVLDEVDWLIARKKSQAATDKSDSGKKTFHADAQLGSCSVRALLKLL